MADVITSLHDANAFSLVLRLVLATLFGGIIGLERESRGHSAGFRTFTLVCLGSALGTIVNLYLFDITGSADTSRIPAGIVSGIGFLGVGTIIVTHKNTVKGLTTAATLWTTSCLGIALGSGMIWLGSISFVLILLTTGFLSKISRYIAAHNKEISLYIEIEKDKKIEELIEYIHKKDYGIITMEKKREKVSKNCDIVIMLEIDLKKQILHSQVMNELSKLDCVYYLEEVRN